MEDGKDILGGLNIQEKIVEDFNKYFVPKDSKFSLTHPQEVSFLPDVESRFNKYSTEKILEMTDISGYIQKKIWENPSFGNEMVWSSYVSKINTNLRSTLISRNILGTEIDNFALNSNDRIKMWADPDISRNTFWVIGEKIGIPPGDVWDMDMQKRKINIYSLEAGKICKNKFGLDDRVYDEYRGGIEKAKKDIKLFDSIIHNLWKSKALELTSGGRTIVPSVNITSEQSHLFNRCKDIVSSWNSNGEVEATDFIEEVNSSAERLDINYRLKNSTELEDYFFNTPNVKDNLGSLLGVGLILTEKTRKYFKDSGLIRNWFRLRMRRNHPDRGGDEEASKSITAAYEILVDKNKFEKWINGKGLFEI